MTATRCFHKHTKTRRGYFEMSKGGTRPAEYVYGEQTNCLDCGSQGTAANGGFKILPEPVDGKAINKINQGQAPERWRIKPATKDGLAVTFILIVAAFFTVFVVVYLIHLGRAIFG